MKRYSPGPNEYTHMEEDSDGSYVEHREAALAVAAEREKWQTLNDQYVALKGAYETLKAQLQHSCDDERADSEGLACPLGYRVSQLEAENERLKMRPASP